MSSSFPNLSQGGITTCIFNFSSVLEGKWSCTQDTNSHVSQWFGVFYFPKFLFFIWSQQLHACRRPVLKWPDLIRSFVLFPLLRITEKSTVTVKKKQKTKNLYPRAKQNSIFFWWQVAMVGRFTPCLLIVFWRLKSGYCFLKYFSLIVVVIILKC